MTDVWITTTGTNSEAVLNPFIAACEEKLLLEIVYPLESDDTAEEISQVCEVARIII